MITKRLTMKGLLVRDWLDRQGGFENEVEGYFKTGKLKSKETKLDRHVFRRAAGDMLAHDVGQRSGPACGGVQIGILAANRLKAGPDARSLQIVHCSQPIELLIGGQVDFVVILSVNFLDDVLGVSFGISQ